MPYLLFLLLGQNLFLEEATSELENHSFSAVPLLLINRFLKISHLFLCP